MSTIYIHPGMHKTGTSSIQESLAALPDGRGPKLLSLEGNPNLSTHARLAITEPEKYARLTKREAEAAAARGPAYRAMLEEMFAANADRDAVISAEGLSVFNERETTEFIDLVRHDEVAIVVYVREPAGAAASRVQQQIKAGVSIGTLPQYVPKYRKFLAKYVRLAELVANLSYDFVPYDRRLLHNGCVVQDFCRRIGVGIAADEVLNRNESLTREATQLLYCRNLHLERAALPRRTASDFVEILNGVGGPKFRLSRAVIEAGLDLRTKHMAWITRRMPDGWLSDDRPDDGSEIASVEGLTAVPEAARTWLAERIPDYDGAADPLAIGAAVEQLLNGLRDDVVQQRKAEHQVEIEQRKAQRKADHLAEVEQRRALRKAEAEQRKAERLAEAAQRRAAAAARKPLTPAG